MFLSEQIKTDLISALKQKNGAVVSTLRMVSAAVKNKEIEVKKREEGLSDEEIIEVLAKEAKKRKDAIEAYKQGGREELAQKEQTELSVIEAYLPAQMSEEEIKKEVQSIIKETKATNMKDMGKVMSMTMAKLKGKADGTVVNDMVKRALS